MNYRYWSFLNNTSSRQTSSVSRLWPSVTSSGWSLATTTRPQATAGTCRRWWSETPPGGDMSGSSSVTGGCGWRGNVLYISTHLQHSAVFSWLTSPCIWWYWRLWPTPLVWNLGSFVHIVFMCLLEGTLNAVDPFYVYQGGRECCWRIMENMTKFPLALHFACPVCLPILCCWPVNLSTPADCLV